MPDIQYITECLSEWWKQLSYTAWMYFALFLPLTMLIYQLVQRKYRRLVLLAAGWFFFFSLSGILLLANILSSVFVWGTGIELWKAGNDKSLDRKERKKKKNKILLLSTVLLLLVLILFKYLDFIGLNIVRFTQLVGVPFNWRILKLAVPVGISYYTLESISYLTEIYRGNTEAEKSLINVCLFMSFFPKLVEGPVTRYDEGYPLFSGEGIKEADVACGYQRILWGLFKKLCIADHLAPAVSQIFEGEYMDGGVAIFGAFLFTLQEYMDFSGSIDVAIGSARIFGVRLPENFRQPFFAKNASDFWRRWHITLGRFFRDYIFYPVALARPVTRFTKKVKDTLGKNAAKLITPAIALFPVWLANGVWHGARWSYIFYGMYYFVIVYIETVLEEPVQKLLERLHIMENSVPLRVFRYLKLMLIVVIGEMFFRAETLSQGFAMFKLILTDLRFDMVIDHIQDIGIDRYGYIVIIVGIIVVSLVEILKEAGIPIRAGLESLPLPCRFIFWYVCIFFVIIFGAYGTGYDSVDLLYAQF
ncbi:MAG: MBOAT family protein [Lachnospiraceae bacterium]|nr:MBOAT family protein [Lachnospiraceae bacterium]